MLAKTFVTVIVALFGFIAPLSAQSQYLDERLSWMVPFAAGGGYDVRTGALGRAMQNDLPKDRKIVVNKS
jgi:tripartite-type tricarboxylate transporter receptor subunit TctC